MTTGRTGPIYVDARWKGEHGIGRFANEVIKRLTLEWRPLGGPSSPTAIGDTVNFSRMRLSPSDTVYSPGFNAGLTRATQLLNIHDLIHLQIESERSMPKTVYYNTIVRPAVRRAGVVMTDSRASAAVIRDWLATDSVDVVVVGCGRSAEFVGDGARASFDRPTFIYVGNLKPHKNVGTILDAIAGRPEYDLLLVTGDVVEARRQTAQRGVERQVSIRTGVSDSDLAELYRGATGALQPSLVEGFGLPALEAMSCGTRIAYWAGCESVAEISASTGVEVPGPDDAGAWSRALDELAELSVAGPLRMGADWEVLYDWDSVATKVQGVIVGSR